MQKYIYTAKYKDFDASGHPYICKEKGYITAANLNAARVKLEKALFKIAADEFVIEDIRPA